MERLCPVSFALQHICFILFYSKQCRESVAVEENIKTITEEIVVDHSFSRIVLKIG